MEDRAAFVNGGGDYATYSAFGSDANDRAPPIGVFWDIENCQVPKNKSAVAIAQCIRDTFFYGHHEAEFMCVCDIHKESQEVVQELINAQVTVVHIGCQSKNAADHKLRQSIRRFADIHSPPATIVLISGDVNFATDLSDLRYRKKLRIVIVHNGFATEPLLICANVHISFVSLVSKIPNKSTIKQQTSKKSCELYVGNLPADRDVSHVRNRLKQLSDNCGGKVGWITAGVAQIRFPNADSTLRARKRMDNEDVFGNRISVNFPPGNNASNSDPGVGQHTSPHRQNKKNPAVKYHGCSSPNQGHKVSSHNGTPGKVQQPNKKCVFPPPPNAQSMQNRSKSNGGTDPFSLATIWDGDATAHNAFKNGNPSERISAFSSVAEKDVFKRPYDARGTGGARGNLYAGQRGPNPAGFGATSDCEFGRRKKKLGGCRSDGYGTSSSDDGMQTNFRHRMMGYGQEGARRIIGKQKGNDKFGFVEDGRGERAKSGDDFPYERSTAQARHYGPRGQMTRSGRSTPSPQPYPGAGWSSGSSASSSPRLPRQQNPYFAAVGGLESQFDSNAPNEPVDLFITNLDQGIDPKEMKRLLHNAFIEHVMVLHVSVNLSPDGSLTAGIRVPSIQDAQLAISQLHRRYVGSKRILISVMNSGDGPPLSVLRCEVVALLMDVPRNNLPLFKFRELYEKRYHRSIGISELHKLNDVVAVQENASGRIVSLTADYRNTPSPACSDGSKEVQEIFELAHCEIHCRDQDQGKGWAEKEQALQLPNVVISLKCLAPKVHSLLQLHVNSIPLNSFPICYECEFGKLNTVEEDGAPLEHLVTCIPGVHIVRGPSRIKRLEWIDENSLEHPELRSISPPLASQQALFCREIVDLLKIQPYCRMPISKFIPIYHHHFGRQCRVADYGYTRLVDLLESLPHVIQIIGEGTKRLITLTHRAQIKRFTADLLRILKSQASKQILLSEFSEVYAKCLCKEFSVFNYGVCDIADLLPEISEGSVVITENGSETVIAIPKREQTTEETDRTKQFASEAVELLRLSPRYCMAFTKFIPAYHHHFGKQCRVSDYGFAKLIELFEAIPETVEVQASKEEDEKLLQLTQPEMLQVFANQISTMMQAPGKRIMTLDKLLATFIQMHGYSLHPEDFGASDVRELLQKISHVVKVVETSSGLIVTAVDRDHVLHQSICARRILLDQPDGRMGVDEFIKSFKSRYGHKCSIGQICSDLKEFVKVEGNGSGRMICINPLQMLMKDVVLLLQENDGRLPLAQFEAAFLEKFKRPCVPAQYGLANLNSLLLAMHEVVGVKGRSGKKSMTLNADGPCYLALFKSTKIQTQPLQKTQNAERKNALFDRVAATTAALSSIDLMSDPIPCRIPSPGLRPLPVRANSELIHFDSPARDCVDDQTFLPALQQQTLHLSNLMDGHPESMYFNMLPSQSSPYYPPPSSVPPVPVTWMYQPVCSPVRPTCSPVAIPPVSSTYVPTTPIASGHDSSENEMNTPPCIRELIAPSSAESTPSQPTARNRYKPRIAARFSNPILPPS